METLEAIKNRRSIRKFKNEPVDDKTLEILLDAARLAPSWANTQCWKFVVIRNGEIRSKIAEKLAVHGSSGNNPAANGIKAAPVLIIACAEKDVAGFSQGKPSTDKGNSWYMFDLGLAMENLVLAATSLGLGTVHVGLFDAAQVAEIIGVPASHVVVSMTPVGYPEYLPSPRPRKELSEIVFHETFGHK
jgi:nitroreductase